MRLSASKLTTVETAKRSYTILKTQKGLAFLGFYAFHHGPAWLWSAAQIGGPQKSGRRRVKVKRRPVLSAKYQGKYRVDESYAVTTGPVPPGSALRPAAGAGLLFQDN